MFPRPFCLLSSTRDRHLVGSLCFRHPPRHKFAQVVTYIRDPSNTYLISILHSIHSHLFTRVEFSLKSLCPPLSTHPYRHLGTSHVSASSAAPQLCPLIRCSKQFLSLGQADIRCIRYLLHVWLMSYENSISRKIFNLQFSIRSSALDVYFAIYISSPVTYYI